MNVTGITLSAGRGISTVMIQPSGVTVNAPTVNVGAVLNTPELNTAAATVSGIPL